MASEPIRAPRVVGLDDIEGLHEPTSTMTWHPVRAELGLRAFGTNAFSAQRPGDEVVEPHSENLDTAHEELYFVARGRASFTIDGEQIDAPAGTYVFVPDPRSHRHAVAAEAETWVLTFGGPPTFTPSAWEWAFRAHAVRADDPAAARKLLDEGLAELPGSPRLLYELACLLALAGDEDGALRELHAAITGDPSLEAIARRDEDLVSIRERLG